MYGLGQGYLVKKKTTFHMEIPELKVVTLMLTSSKLPLNLLCHLWLPRKDNFSDFHFEDLDPDRNPDP